MGLPWDVCPYTNHRRHVRQNTGNIVGIYLRFQISAHSRTLLSDQLLFSRSEIDHSGMSHFFNLKYTDSRGDAIVYFVLVFERFFP
jgi:hypothetical protein